MIVFSSAVANQNSRAALAAIQSGGHLAQFWTTMAVFQGDFLHRLSSIPRFRDFRRRMYPSSLESATRQNPIREIGRLALGKIPWAERALQEENFFSIDSVLSSHDRRVADNLPRAAAEGASAVYAYEDAALETFRAAKSIGLRCNYDLPIGYWRAARSLMQEQLQRRPEWASTLRAFRDSNAKLERKDLELRLADQIIVASSFTASTLEEFSGTLAPIKVVPYGFPEVDSSPREYWNGSGALKVLFVGSLSQRKGLADLLDAVEQLKPYVELTMVGMRTSRDCAPLERALQEHRWIPTLSHEKVLALMREQHVLIFPSHFEGFGLVISEAMSQGTPVITTERTAGPDLIQHGSNGWLFPAGDVSALVARISSLLSNPGSIQAAGREARQTAKSRPWHEYGKELRQVVLNDACMGVKV